MVKKFALMMVVGMQLVGVGTALAAEVNFSGDASLKYEKDTMDGEADHSGVMSTVKVKMEADLGNGWSLFGRIGAQHATDPVLADFNPDAYKSGKKTVVGFDQFGISYKQDDLTYRFGRQDATVGTTALLYSRSDSNIGKHQFVDGLSVTGKTGVVDLSVLAAREDNVTSEKNKIYAVRAGFSPEEDFSYGLTLGRYHYDGGDTTNHWAVDTTYKAGKHSWTMEYTKSNRSEQNKAYAANWNYDFDGQLGAYVTAFRVEANGDMGGQSDFDNNNKGIYYGLTYKFSDVDGVEVVYKDQKTLDAGVNNTKLEATYTHSF
ncbi:MAG: hypothetical protein E6713_05695 [Sporomusaceae bacterium]|nr:hypothetical protein [Sporomusaceae bacterium]